MIATAVIACVVVVLANVITYILNEHSLVWKLKCVPPPRLLFCSNRRLKRRPEQFWAFDTLDPDWLTTSYLVPTWVLAALRLCILLYVVAEILIERYTTSVGLGDPDYVWISFFTDWTFCVFGASGLIGFLVTLWRMAQRARSRKLARVQPDAEAGHGVSRSNGVDSVNGVATPAEGSVAAPLPPAANGGTAAPHTVSAPGSSMAISSSAMLTRKWTWYEAIYLLVFETSAACELFLTVFYWAALAGDGNRTADNIMKHGTNNILIFLDVILSRAPFLSYHFWVSLLYGTLYLLFMWAVWLPTEDYWVYSVFDWGHWRSVGAYVVLPIAVFIAFAIWTAVAALREWVGRRHPSPWSTAPPAAKAAEVQLQPIPRQPEPLQQLGARPHRLPPPPQQQQQQWQGPRLAQPHALPQAGAGSPLQGANIAAAQGGDASPLGVQGADFMGVTARTTN